jgi:hypothetical protein
MTDALSKMPPMNVEGDLQRAIFRALMEVYSGQPERAYDELFRAALSEEEISYVLADINTVVQGWRGEGEYGKLLGPDKTSAAWRPDDPNDARPPQGFRAPVNSIIQQAKDSGVCPMCKQRTFWNNGDEIVIQSNWGQLGPKIVVKAVRRTSWGQAAWIAVDPRDNQEYEIQIDGTVLITGQGGDDLNWEEWGHVVPEGFAEHDGLSDSEPGDTTLPEDWSKLAEVMSPEAPTIQQMPDPNFVLDYNPEDARWELARGLGVAL